MSWGDLSFYERRAREEAEAAEASPTPERASAHRLLALEYEAHARELRARSDAAEPAAAKTGRSEG